MCSIVSRRAREFRIAPALVRGVPAEIALLPSRRRNRFEFAAPQAAMENATSKSPGFFLPHCRDGRIGAVHDHWRCPKPARRIHQSEILLRQ